MITDNYKALQKELHKNESYGTSSLIYRPVIEDIMRKMEPKSVLDYGCGKGLSKEIISDINLCDPCVDEYSSPPEAADFVICTDVLEHIEPEMINSVLEDLARLTLRVGFFAIHTGPAMKTLSDGRNAHLIQEDYRWWLPKIMSRFDIHTL